MHTSFSFGLFQPSVVVLVPVIIFLALGLLYIPSMMVPGAKPDAVGKAIACYLMKTFGILLMTLSMLPLVYNIVSNTMPPMPTISALVLVFLFGAGTVLYYNIVVHQVDDASVIVVRTVFAHGFEVIGAIIALLSALSILLTFMITQTVDGWEMPATALLFGLLLSMMFSVHISERNRRTRTSKKK